MTAALALLLAALSATPAKAASPARQGRERQLTITDATLHDLRPVAVSGGQPTTLVFSEPLDPNGVVLVDLKEGFFPPRVTDKTVVVVPKKDLKYGDALALTVTLADGTPLPFKLSTERDATDWQVTVTIALDKKAAQASSKSLRDQVAALQARLDDVTSQAGDAGLRKVGQLIAAQNPDAPVAFSVEKRDLSWRDKQSRLLVRARTAYRLFDHSYLVLSVKNRDTTAWVFDKATVKLAGGGSTADVRVLDTAAELTTLQPDEEGRLVVIFATPPQQKKQTFDVQILEKNGSRHVDLDGLEL